MMHNVCNGDEAKSDERNTQRLDAGIQSSSSTRSSLLITEALGLLYLSPGGLQHLDRRADVQRLTVKVRRYHLQTREHRVENFLVMAGLIGYVVVHPHGHGIEDVANARPSVCKVAACAHKSQSVAKSSLDDASHA